MSATLQKALIVDDEGTIRYFLSVGLGEMGFECATAANGHEALDQLAKEQFDLMVLDVRMPGMDGLEVLRRMRERNDATHVVMLTALGAPEMAAQALTTLGADAFLGKPCTLEELSTTINAVLATAQQKARVPTEGF